MNGVRMNRMMQTASQSHAQPFGHSAASTQSASQPFLLPLRRARRLQPEQGRAIEKLAHAIEYLSDELAMQCMTARANAFESQPIQSAIEMLKRCNREIYLACPPMPTLRERLRGFVSRAMRQAQAGVGL